MPKAKTFEEKYPHLAKFVIEQGWIEIGQDEYSHSFVRAIDPGGVAYEGKDTYKSMEDAFKDLDAGIKVYMNKWGI